MLSKDVTVSPLCTPSPRIPCPTRDAARSLSTLVNRALNKVVEATKLATARSLCGDILRVLQAHSDTWSPAAAKRIAVPVVKLLLNRAETEALHAPLYASIHALLLAQLSEHSTAGNTPSSCVSGMRKALQNCMVDQLVVRSARLGTSCTSEDVARGFALFFAELYGAGCVPEQIVHHCIRTAARLRDSEGSRETAASARAAQAGPMPPHTTLSPRDAHPPQILHTANVAFICTVLGACGKKLDSPCAKSFVNAYFDCVERACSAPPRSRIRCEIDALCQKRASAWGDAPKCRHSGGFQVLVKRKGAAEQAASLDTLVDTAVLPYVRSTVENAQLQSQEVHLSHAVLSFTGVVPCPTDKRLPAVSLPCGVVLRFFLA